MEEKCLQTDQQLFNLQNKLCNLQNKMDGLDSLAYVLMLAANEDLIGSDMSGALFILSNISNDVCRDLEVLQADLAAARPKTAIKAATVK